MNSIAVSDKVANASFKCALVNIEDPIYTLQALIAASFYRSLKADSTTEAHVKAQCALLGDVKEIIRKMFRFSFVPAEKSKRIGYAKTGGYFEICSLWLVDPLQPLQKGPHYFTQVWKVPQKDVSEVFLFLDTSKDIQEDLVLKLWDEERFEVLFAAYATSKGWSSLEALENYVGQLYSNEIACYKRINWYNSKNNTQIKSPKLYGYGKMTLNEKMPCGYFDVSLIASYIQNGEYTGNIIQSGIEQLKLFHKAGILLGDDAKRNFVVAEDGGHFIGFSHSRLYKTKVPADVADRELRSFKSW